DVEVRDVEGDVLFRLPVDRLGQLRLGHNRQVDLLDDDSVAGERGCDLFGLERLVLESPPDRVRDRRAVDDGAVDDAVGWYRLGRGGDDLEILARRFQLDRLDGVRSDVEAYDVL